MRKQADDLQQIARDVLVAAGASELNAAEVADHLVRADLSGVDTHGTMKVADYVKAIRAEEVLPRERPVIDRDLGAGALVVGNWTFGQVTAKFAMELAIERATENGIAIVGIVQVHHIGRLGHYVEMAAAEGLISMVCAGGFGVVEPSAVPYGGRTPVLHTNPIAMGFPVADAAPMMFDFATTAVSGMKVVNARRRGQQLPPGSIVDADGNPTTDPDAFFAGGGHLPFGAHKGYALMMGLEFLGRIFSGSDDFAEEGRGGVIMGHQGVTMLAIKADLVRDASAYLHGAAQMMADVHAVPPAPGFAEVLAPGDLEARTRAQREREGIPVHDDAWQDLLDAASSVGLTVG